MDLPIKFNETKDENLANLIISFGANLLKTTSSTPGKCQVTASDGLFKKSKIEIRNEDNYYLESKAFILLHEMGHVLGISDHVISTSKSAFNPNTNCELLSEDDKTAIKMLYDPCWPKMYYMPDFENDFSEYLYHLNLSKKHFEPSKERALDSILKYSLLYDTIFRESSIVKFSTPVRLIISGDLEDDMYEVIKSTIDEINCSSSNIKMEYFKSDTKSTIGAINIHFTHNPNMIGDTIVSNTKSPKARNAHFVVSRYSDINFNYKENYEKNKKVISYLIFNSICEYPYKSYISLIDIVDKKVKFNQFLRDMLNLLYSDEFPYNINEKVLEQLKKKSKNRA